MLLNFHLQLAFMILTSCSSSRCAQAGRILGPWTDIDAPPSTTLSRSTIYARSTNDVVHDKFFIPAIASIGVVVLLGAVCFYKLGWCFNREQRNRVYLRTAYPAPVHSTSQRLDSAIPQPQPDSMQAQGNMNTWGKRQSKVQRKAPSPVTYSNVAPGSPPAGSRPENAQYAPQPPFGVPQVQEYRGSPPAVSRPESAQYTPQPPLGVPQAAPVQGYQSSVSPGPPASILRTSPAPVGTSRGYWTQEGPRMSTLSSEQSSTQIGSGEPSFYPAAVYPLPIATPARYPSPRSTSPPTNYRAQAATVSSTSDSFYGVASQMAAYDKIEEKRRKAAIADGGQGNTIS